MPLSRNERTELERLLAKASPGEVPGPASEPHGNYESEAMQSALMLKSMRESRGLSLREAAERAGVTHGTISNLEKMPTPWDGVSFGTLRGLARAFNISEDTMFEIARGGERSVDADREIHGSLALEGRQIPASEWVDQNWVKLDLHDPRAVRVPSESHQGGHVFTSTFNFTPSHRPDTTLAFQLDDAFFVTRQALRHPGVETNFYVLVSTVLAGGADEIVLAHNKASDRVVLYLGREAGTKESAIPLNTSEPPANFQLPTSSEPGFEDVNWRVIGPVFSFIR